MKKSISLLFTSTLSLFAAGYQIPNNSINSNALATANIANANGADTAYYNPANMIYNTNNHEIEASLTYVLLSPINYNPTDNSLPDIKSKKYSTVSPSIHYVSSKLSENGLRVGFSLAPTYGLTREWEDEPAIKTAKKFSLRAIEFNPSVALPITDKLSVGIGIRVVLASGEVQVVPVAGAVSVDMKGDDTAYGYNLALSYKVSDTVKLSATYRSHIMLNLKGNAKILFAPVPTLTDSTASLEVAIPDNFILACAYKVNPKTTVEFTFDTTFWSKVTETNFDYTNPIAEAALGTKKDKLWRDSYAYRLGITHLLNNSLTLMSGIAYNTNASEEKYVSFSSPEADSMTYSLGARYNSNENLDFGVALLYADYKDRTSNNTDVKGTFSSKDAVVITLGASYKF